MKTFILINRLVREKEYYSRILNYLLVNKMLEVRISNPNILIEYSDIDFDLN